MKFLVLFSCALAVASAGYASSYSYPYAQHIPVIGPNGVPVDTPEVQHARAAHFSALAEASARSGSYVPAPEHSYAPAPYANVPSPYANAPFYGLSASGHPLDTPEVAAAKLQHQHDFAAAAQRNGVYLGAVGHALGAYPADTPEVQHAKAAHFAAHAAARSNLHYRKRRGLYPQHVPVIGPGGVPVETPEVQHAKAAHFAAHAAAGGHLGYAAPYYAPVPVLAHNALPADTPEVAHAKAAHFAAHAAARSGYHGYASPYAHYQPQAVIGHDGHPVETPEVQLAKAAHFAAHAQALTHHY